MGFGEDSFFEGGVVVKAENLVLGRSRVEEVLDVLVSSYQDMVKKSHLPVLRGSNPNFAINS